MHKQKNAYEELYRSHNFKISQVTTSEQAEQMARQLGYLFNTIGIAIKDITKLLSFKYPPTQKKVNTEISIANPPSKNLEAIQEISDSPKKVLEIRHIVNQIISEEEQIQSQMIAQNSFSHKKVVQEQKHTEIQKENEPEKQSLFVYQYTCQNGRKGEDMKQSIQKLAQYQLPIKQNATKKKGSRAVEVIDLED